ncbi:hypothetical protein ACE1TH_15385 [Shouchella sp. JSM 1781072]|uniref:hypothetical protein n=1 Tax=Shouchella sp. JSM 1781072 TaxID=3344581 RepID=UPI0035BF7249
MKQYLLFIAVFIGLLYLLQILSGYVLTILYVQGWITIGETGTAHYPIAGYITAVVAATMAYGVSLAVFKKKKTTG